MTSCEMLEPRKEGPVEMVVTASGLGKCYQVYKRPSDRIKQALFANRRYFRERWSLRHVSFDVREGEVVGIVGRNGAGKSTLLSIIAGIIAPTEGRVVRIGRMFALLEIGSGFNPEFTGHENIRTNAAILGLSQEEIEAIEPTVMDFAELGEYMEQPVKTYSTGMYARLAMSLALHLPAELLLIDEILAVGDVFFQMKCYERVQQLMMEGRTVLLCSHDLGAVRRHCTRVLYLEEGRLVADGRPDDVLAVYLESGQRRTCETRQSSLPHNQSDEAAGVTCGRRTRTATASEAAPFEVRVAPEWRPDEQFLSLVRNPRGVVLLENGNLLVADLFSHCLVEVSASGSTVGKWCKTGFGPDQIYDPVGLEALPDGSVAAADYSTSRVLAVYPDGRTSVLFRGCDIGEQVFLVRFDPSGRAWISSRGDSRVRIVEANGCIRQLSEYNREKRYVTDISFRGDDAYLADFKNDEILILNARDGRLKRIISLAGVADAHAPHGIAFVDGHIVVTCHDSHTLAVVPVDISENPSVTTLDLRGCLLEHPCYVITRGNRLYVTASTMGALTALDISGWPGPGGARTGYASAMTTSR